jgi:hypothetical protein
MMQPKAFDWQCHPDAERWLLGLVEDLTARMAPLRRLAHDIRLRTGGRLVDWLDHVIVADAEITREQLHDLGFEREEVPADPGDQVYCHSGATFPRVVLRPARAAQGEAIGAAIQVEELHDFLMAQHIVAPIEGSPLSPYRRACTWQHGPLTLLAVERRGHGGFLPLSMPPDYPARALRAYEHWAARPRALTDERAGMEHTLALARSLAADLGTDQAAWIAFAAERVHWQQRNRAGQVQKALQDSLGLGWANHDHHTFRSSRDAFPVLIQILEAFGFRARERFYAGAEAGWGAQVMEQPVCRLAVFADVDLSADEVVGDFAHRSLPPRASLGTVGLWCALHGQSMLGAGLHHLAGRFDFDSATAGLAERGIKLMHPFSSFSYLRQAFTQGERWPVAKERIESLLDAGVIGEAQCYQFADKGAIGSHLENIQRGEGFKGFNQHMISDIIRRTDPRAADPES